MPRQYHHCSGVLIIHGDKSVTCTAHECRDLRMIEQMIDAHSMFVPCHSAFGSQGCPACDFHDEAG